MVADAIAESIEQGNDVVATSYLFTINKLVVLHLSEAVEAAFRLQRKGKTNDKVRAGWLAVNYEEIVVVDVAHKPRPSGVGQDVIDHKFRTIRDKRDAFCVGVCLLGGRIDLMGHLNPVVAVLNYPDSGIYNAKWVLPRFGIRRFLADADANSKERLTRLDVRLGAVRFHRPRDPIMQIRIVRMLPLSEILVPVKR